MEKRTNLHLSPKTTTIEQFALLIQKIEEHPELAKRAQLNATAASQLNKQWKELTKELNAKGPPERSVEEWKKVLCDSKVKKVQKQIHQNAKAGCSKLHFLETEKALERAIHFTETIKPKGETFGLPNIANLSNNIAKPALEGNLEEPSDPPLSSTYKRRSPLTACEIPNKSAQRSLETSSLRRQKTSSKRKISGAPYRLLHRQLSQETEYLEMTRDIASLMNTQSICIEEFQRSAEKQGKLMKQQLELLEKQTSAIERQAAALERMSSF